MSLSRYLYNRVLLEADDDETATDYTADNNDDNEEPEGNVGNDDIATDYTNDEPEDQGDNQEDNNNDQAEDYTQTDETNDEDQDGEQPEDDTEENADGEEDTPEGEDDDNGEDEETATDYTDDADTDTDDTEEDTDDTDTSPDSGNIKRNTLIKNYNLLNDFNKVYNLVNDTISNIESTVYGDVVQTKIVNQVLKNLTRIKEFILTFIKYYFNDNLYEFNLYYYETIMTSLELNLKILTKIKDIASPEQNSKKLKKRSVFYNG